MREREVAFKCNNKKLYQGSEYEFCGRGEATTTLFDVINEFPVPSPESWDHESHRLFLELHPTRGWNGVFTWSKIAGAVTEGRTSIYLGVHVGLETGLSCSQREADVSAV
ncbi:hypothetical protein TNCV_1045021 [Trichonephila clavipes]|nr:hypothetical protein TNCV_1045021 [Trichonephila clavipes]